MNIMNLKIGDLVIFKDCFCCATIIEINGNIAKLNYLDKIIIKKLTSLKLPKKFKIDQYKQQISNRIGNFNK